MLSVCRMEINILISWGTKFKKGKRGEADIDIINICKQRYEKFNSKMEQYQPCKTNHLWLGHRYHTWSNCSAGISDRDSWGFVHDCPQGTPCTLFEGQGCLCAPTFCLG